MGADNTEDKGQACHLIYPAHFFGHLLTSTAKAGEILIGPGACNLIKDKNILKVGERGKMPVKGRKKEVGIFNVVGLDEAQY